MADGGKLQSLDSSSTRSQQSKLLNLSNERLETRLSLKDLEELMVAFMVILQTLHTLRKISKSILFPNEDLSCFITIYCYINVNLHTIFDKAVATEPPVNLHI